MVLLKYVALPAATYIRITTVVYELTWTLFHRCKGSNKGCFTASELRMGDQWTAAVHADDIALLAE